VDFKQLSSEVCGGDLDIFWVLLVIYSLVGLVEKSEKIIGESW
jgi:hypothetical protein